MLAAATLAVKVSDEFAREYRRFCEEHCLQIGRFTEHALAEMMEDYHLGLKAQRVLSRSSGETVEHARYFGAPRRRR